MHKIKIQSDAASVEKYNDDINCHKLYDFCVRISVRGKTIAFPEKISGNGE